METAYRVGTKEKTDRLFNRIFESIINTEKGEDNKIDNEPTIYNQIVNDNQNIEQEVIDLTEEFSNYKNIDEIIIRKEILKVLNELKNKNIKTNEGQIITVENRGIEHIDYKKEQKQPLDKLRTNIALKQIEDIISKSILVNTKKVDKESVEHNSKRAREWKLNNLDNTKVFETPIKINDKIYYVNLITENYKNRNKNYLYEVYLKNKTQKKQDIDLISAVNPVKDNTTTSNPQSQEIYNQTGHCPVPLYFLILIIIITHYI